MANYDTPYQPKDNTGTIFKNDRKTTETQPDGKGSAVIAGVDYWLSSWTATDKNGNPYRKLAFTPKDQAPPAPPAKTFKPASQDAFKARQLPPQQRSGFDDMDNELPPF